MKAVIEKLDAARDSDGYIYWEDLPEDEFTLSEEGEWEQEGKYQTSYVIMAHKPTNTYWCLNQSRSGSYHTDWYYDTTYITQVEPVEVKKIIWKEVK